MGLDAVEIVMEVEESFGITIPEDRAGNVRTVGDLYAIVLDLTKDINRDNSVCVTASTFRSLRRQHEHSDSVVASIKKKTMQLFSFSDLRIWSLRNRFSKICHVIDWFTDMKKGKQIDP